MFVIITLTLLAAIVCATSTVHSDLQHNHGVKTTRTKIDHEHMTVSRYPDQTHDCVTISGSKLSLPSNCIFDS
ncbi:hypothetical protein F5050DRAFT_1795493 [Lentinula boryana]|uniref:Secreted protein n=1 Tax=Lentinula boryana TaxID=40481 RepID=A0ABQ8PWZ7_9AGAR|nr:hypothetical protein F5050DRAFT_1795493 [Lentinula boryana]